MLFCNNFDIALACNSLCAVVVFWMHQVLKAYCRQDNLVAIKDIQNAFIWLSSLFQSVEYLHQCLIMLLEGYIKLIDHAIYFTSLFFS